MSLLPQVRVNRPTAASSSDVPVQGEDNHTRELSLLLIQAELDLKQYQNDIVARWAFIEVRQSGCYKLLQSCHSEKRDRESMLDFIDDFKITCKIEQNSYASLPKCTQLSSIKSKIDST